MDPTQRTDAIAPERRGFIFLLGVSNAAFAVVDRATGAPRGVLGARLVLAVILLGVPVLLGRPLPARAIRALLRVLAACVALAFGAVAWGTGGTSGPYFVFLPMLPLVFTVAVPDEPWGTFLAGAAAAAVGLACASEEGLPPARLAFWAIAFASATAYGVAGAILHRRQRAREARLERDRASAVEELAESERRRARAERLALVGRVAGSAAHDLANPLAFVRADLGVVEQALGAGADPDVRDALGDIRVGLERMKQIVEDLRAFAREADPAPTPSDVAVVVDEALRLVGARLRAVAVVERVIPEALPPVGAGRAHLVRAVLRLLADAADAADASRRPGAARPRVRISARAAAGAVELAVDHDAVAGGDRGSGLAIALAREEVEAFGGRVNVAHRDGGGASVIVRLPVAADEGGEREAG